MTTVDARGTLCPVPVIELAKAIRDVADGEVVTVLADDPAAATDIPAWCRMRGHDFLGATPVPHHEGGQEYRVRRVGRP